MQVHLEAKALRETRTIAKSTPNKGERVSAPGAVRRWGLGAARSWAGPGPDLTGWQGRGSTGHTPPEADRPPHSACNQSRQAHGGSDLTWPKPLACRGSGAILWPHTPIFEPLPLDLVSHGSIRATLKGLSTSLHIAHRKMLQRKASLTFFYWTMTLDMQGDSSSTAPGVAGSMGDSIGLRQVLRRHGGLS